MREQACPTCRSADHVRANSTNYAARYLCRNCERVFDPDVWDCPSCGDRDPVAQSPFDDPAQYYCFRCDFAFSRLGAQFDEESVVYGHLHEAFDDAGKRLTLTTETREGPATGTIECMLSLRNDGATPILTQGATAIAIQYRVDDDRWWTIYGNPRRHSPSKRVILEPGDSLRREVTFEPYGIQGESIQLTRQDPLYSGTYRILYWGLPETDAVLATQLPIEFDHGW